MKLDRFWPSRVCLGGIRDHHPSRGGRSDAFHKYAMVEGDVVVVSPVLMRVVEIIRGGTQC